ncbi:MAG: imidazolonepropionase [Thermoplasmata archaeon]|nr:imidazolonepropionase [Thermoplasmata archaeon]
MIRADRLLTGIDELATLAGRPGPRVGRAMRELSLVHDAAVAFDQGRVVAVGPARQVLREVRLRRGGKREEHHGLCALPGLVDAHTHLLFGGDRHREVGAKLDGASYAEIARRGGGLFSTVRATRRASEKELLDTASSRLRRMASAGTVAAEVKSGYALSHKGELRLLRLLPQLERRTGVTIVPTYLGAHAVPPGRSRPEYVREVVERTLPVVAREGLAKFCDVFCEPGFFTVDDARRILRRAAQLGLGLKLHADEFEAGGGTRLAAELRVRSVEHLLTSPPDDWPTLARARVTAVLLPLTPYASLSPLRSLGRELVDAGVPVALGSDCSPNSWVESMTLVLSSAVYGARMTPAEAITAATVNSAHASGLPAGTGTISVGGSADLVLFDVRSVEEIPYRIGASATQVYRRGVPILSTALRE